MMLVLAALALPAPAAASFEYIPPAEAPALAVAAESAGTLGETLARLAPDGSALAWDWRVDPAQPLDRDYADWQSLLEGEGLAWTPTGGGLIVHPAAIAPAAAATTPGAEPVVSWRIVAGELLRDVLDRWGERGGVDIVWLTDRRWRIDETRVYQGSFLDAARQLLFGLSHLPVAPVGELAANGRSLTIVHRAPPPVPEDPA